MGKVDDLNARVGQLEDEKRDLDERRKRLDLPAIDREMLSALVDDFEDAMAEGTNPQKKGLLRRLAKKVLVHDKRSSSRRLHTHYQAVWGIALTISWTSLLSEQVSAVCTW